MYPRLSPGPFDEASSAFAGARVLVDWSRSMPLIEFLAEYRAKDAPFLHRLVTFIRSRDTQDTALQGADPGDLFKEATPAQQCAWQDIIYRHQGKCIITADPNLGTTYLACKMGAYYGGRRLFVVQNQKRAAEFIAEYKKWTNETLLPIKNKKQAVTLDFQTHHSWVVTVDVGKTIIPLLSGVTWQSVIVDDATGLKGKRTVRSHEWTKLIHLVPVRLLFVRLPTVCRPTEWYNLLYALHPELFPERDEFKARYSRLAEKMDGTKFENGCLLPKEFEYVTRLFTYQTSSKSGSDSASADDEYYSAENVVAREFASAAKRHAPGEAESESNKRVCV